MVIEFKQEIEYALSLHRKSLIMLVDRGNRAFSQWCLHTMFWFKLCLKWAIHGSMHGSIHGNTWQ
jgi:hypothetical protein